MDQDRETARRIEYRRARRIGNRPSRARHALDDRVDRLEVARVRRHRDDEIHFAPALDRAVRPRVVLHVARPGHILTEHA
jgi:hypothetical protein